MQYLSSPVSKISLVTTYIILIVTGIINVAIVDYSYYMGDLFGEYNIIDLELAGSVLQAKTILDYWTNLGVIQWIYFNLGIDFLFIVTYTFFLFFACHTSALQLKSFSFFIHLGLVIGWLQPIAGILDLVENYALIQVLSGSVDEIWPKLASWCSMPKFSIALSGLAYCVIALTISTSSGLLSKMK